MNELLDFIQAFLDNFEMCRFCDGTGDMPDFRIECEHCKGTGKQIVSIGVLYVELPEEARRLLAKYQEGKP